MKDKQESPLESIEDIDPNFKSECVNGRDLAFHDVRRFPFGLSGFPWFSREGLFCRLPKDSIEKMDKIRGGAWHTAGGMVRFRSDSDAIAVKVRLRSAGDMSHMPRTGSAGVDLYRGAGADRDFVSVAFPPAGSTQYTVLLVRDEQGGMRDWSLNFPLYNGVESMHLGVDAESTLAPPDPFSCRKPIVFYGSSITQGGCASRPGTAFAHLLCHWLDAAQVNLGFSGCGMLEPIMAELIAGLDMSALVIDTTNTSLEQKQARYEPFFREIRERRPDLPVVLGCRADYKHIAQHAARRQIVMDTFGKAEQRGDKRTFFADIEKAFGKHYQWCTVDGGHPNDLGFMHIAETYYPVLKRALGE
jgi:hypothetical protein